MNAPSRTRLMLGGSIGLLLLVVVADQLGLVPGRQPAEGGDGAAPSSLRERYLARARRSLEEQRLVASAPEWISAAAKARDAWNSARARMVVAKTAELAEAGARDRVLDALKDLNLSGTRATVMPSPATEASAVVRSITLDVRFDTPSHRDAFAAADRLEHLPGLSTSVTGLKLDGPGRIQTPSSITVTMTVQVLAAIGQES